MLLPAALLVSGCGHADSDPGPGGVTVGEARTLDEAAAMLDRQQLPTRALTAKSSPSADASQTAR
ncbi:MAG: hypothetical protein ABIT09_13025 [Croceibacterium sp.]